MNQDVNVLLLDDGELDSLAVQLEHLEIEFTRLRGGDIGDAVSLPRQLLVTTPRRAAAASGPAPAGCLPGRPVKVIHVAEDSHSMRGMLRERGFDLLVRDPTPPEVWRMLVHRALFQGRERRRDERVHVGSEVDVATREQLGSATLIDISNRGCRIASNPPVVEGTRIRMEIPGAAAGDAPLQLCGDVIRVQAGAGDPTAAVAFDDAMPTETRRQLAQLLNTWTGPGSFAETVEPRLPACESSALPGLTLDDETDPAVRAGVAVSIRISERDRRQHQRAPFGQAVRAASQADSDGGSRILLGRDLSAGGMRVEALDGIRLGDTFEVSLWGPGNVDPFRVEAEVVRDDGDEGFGLRFRNVGPGMARELEKIVACLPDVEPLQCEEADVLGAVIGEFRSARSGQGSD